MTEKEAGAVGLFIIVIVLLFIWWWFGFKTILTIIGISFGALIALVIMARGRR